MDDARAAELLQAERDRIEQALDELSVGAPGAAALDAGDSANELLDAELGEGYAARLRAELEAVTRAEARLSEGRYGRSIESGEPIPEGRLEAIPWAERTADEQARYEQESR